MIKRAFLALALFTGIVALGSPVKAAQSTVTCSIDAVYFDGNRLIVLCTNQPLYYSFINAPGCATANIDTLKTWTSMLSSQMLAAKQAELNINSASSTCGSPTLISVKGLK